jgi:putative transposase
MATACLRRYQAVVIDGEQRILHSRVGNEWQLKDPKDGRITQITLPSLRRKYEEGTLLFLIKGKLSSDIAKELYRSEPRGKPQEVANEAWKLACAKLALVKEVWCLSWQSDTQKQRIRELWPELTKKLNAVPLIPDPSTVHRWWSKLEEYGWDARALLPQDWKKGRKPEAITGVLLDLVDEAVEDKYLTQERLPREDAHEAACTLVDAWNQANPDFDPVPRPTKRQVCRYIDGLDAFDVHAARYGHENAIRKFRSVKGSNIATRPLERVELDHTVLDVIVLDDQTLLPLGRPTIAIALDVFTRCVIGLHVGFEPPSSSTVGQCLRSALLPKSLLLERIPEISGAWDIYGQMEVLVVDQALENHAKLIERATGCLGIELAWCGSKMPWQKGAVERFIQTLNRGFCPKSAATTRSNIKDKGEYDALGRAVCSFSALRRGLIKWVVDVYHVKYHRTLQMAPIGKWNTTICEDDIPLCTDVKVLDTCLRNPKEKPLTHKGIDCNSGLLYNSDELADLRRKYGAELRVVTYASLSDLGSIIVEYPRAQFREEIPCLNPDYARGLTFWQHKAIRKFARKQSIGVATFDDQLKAKMLLESLIYEGMANSPLKTRVTAARMLQKECESRAGREVSGATSAPDSRPKEAAPAPAQCDDFLMEFDGIEAEVH